MRTCQRVGMWRRFRTFKCVHSSWQGTLANLDSNLKINLVQQSLYLDICLPQDEVISPPAENIPQAVWPAVFAKRILIIVAKGIVAWDWFFTIPIRKRCRRRFSNVFTVGVENWQHLAKKDSTPRSESIEWIIEDQAFSLSYDFVLLFPSPLSCQRAPPATDRKTEKERQLAGGRGGKGMGRKPTNSYDSKKAWSSINHTILSGNKQLGNHIITFEEQKEPYTKMHPAYSLNTLNEWAFIYVSQLWKI